jgi:hypothetical protein
MPRGANAHNDSQVARPGYLRLLLFPMEDNLARPGRSIAWNSVGSPEPVYPHLKLRMLDASQTGHGELIEHGPHPADPAGPTSNAGRILFGNPLAHVPKGLGLSVNSRPLAIGPLGSTWNPSSGLPRQSGRMTADYWQPTVPWRRAEVGVEVVAAAEVSTASGVGEAGTYG